MCSLKDIWYIHSDKASTLRWTKEQYILKQGDVLPSQLVVRLHFSLSLVLATQNLRKRIAQGPSSSVSHQTSIQSAVGVNIDNTYRAKCSIRETRYREWPYLSQVALPFVFYILINIKTHWMVNNLLGLFVRFAIYIWHI